jgi:ankyrin repeat protein
VNALASGATPLHCAASNGHASAVAALLAAGAAVDPPLADGRTRGPRGRRCISRLCAGRPTPLVCW